MKKATINILPKTERYFNHAIGELRKYGIVISLSEYINYVAWSLQKYVPNDASFADVEKVTEKDVEHMKEELAQFRKEMKE